MKPSKKRSFLYKNYINAYIYRFEHDVLMRKKQNYVDFPIENLDLTIHTSKNTNTNRLVFVYYLESLTNEVKQKLHVDFDLVVNWFQYFLYSKSFLLLKVKVSNFDISFDLQVNIT